MPNLIADFAIVMSDYCGQGASLSAAISADVINSLAPEFSFKF